MTPAACTGVTRGGITVEWQSAVALKLAARLETWSTQPFVTTDEILTEFFNALARTRGSHRLYRYADGRRVTVSTTEMSDTFPPAIRKSMLETQAQWSNQDLKRLGIGP